MSNPRSHSSSEELDILTSGWMDGQLDEEGAERLQELLRQSSENRNRFLNLIHTDTLASQAMKSEQLIAEPLIPVEKILTDQKRRSSRIALMASVAVILISITVMSFFFIPEKENSELSFDVSEGTRFTLTHDSTNDELPMGQTLAEGSRLQLSQGTVELNFPSGVRGVVMAPADITLRDEGFLTLDRGSAWFHVPKEAVGFTVQTRQMNVVDLGTKFGVSSQPDDALDQVHVFKGEVRVSARRGRKEEVTLRANEACELDPTGQLRTIGCKPAEFLTNLPQRLPHLHWSFDSLDGVDLSVDGTHPAIEGLDSTLKSPRGGARLVDGKFGKALYLDGKGSHVITDWKGFDGSRPRTVSFWLKLPEEGINRETAGLFGWGDHLSKSGKWAIAVRQAKGRDPKSGVKSGKVNKAELALTLGRSMIIVARRLELGKWHHIAVTYSGIPDLQDQYAIQTYVDGELSGLRASKMQTAKPLDTSTYSKDAQPLSMGMTIRSKKEAKNRRYLHGTLDDLYVFDGYMTEDQIKELMRP